MKKLTLIIGAMTFVANTQIANAQIITDNQKCLGAIETIQKMKTDDDTPEIGEKAEAELDAVVEVAKHLCEQESYVYAGKLLEVARGMLASE